LTLLPRGARAYLERQDYKEMKHISSDRAQTTAEYGLIFALVLVAVVATFLIVGDAVQQLWNSFIAAWPGPA
jgi:Flp pilus assembly pilin Flp